MANIIKNPKASEIAAMKPGEMISAESTAERFVQLFNKVHGTEKGANIYEQERFHFMKLIQEKNDLQQCDTISLYGCFLDTAVDGLSLDPSRKLTYIIPENVNVGTKDSPKWIKRARRVISPYGELALRQKYGQIKYADDPVIVYAGDKFSPGTDATGKKFVSYEAKIPNDSNEIIGGFIRIVRVDGSVDFYWMTNRDIVRLKGYSERKNRGTANALYSSSSTGSIDPGFFAAKLIKHAFKSFPKIQIGGTMTKIEDVEEPIIETQPPSEIITPSYEMPTEVVEEEETGNSVAARAANAKEEQPFKVEPKDNYEGF